MKANQPKKVVALKELDRFRNCLGKCQNWPLQLEATHAARQNWVAFRDTKYNYLLV